MKCEKSNYDLNVIALNVFHFCLSVIVISLLSYQLLENDSGGLPIPAKLHTVYGFLIACMLINAGLVIAIIIAPASVVSFNMWFRPLLGTVGAGFQITSGAFLFETYLDATNMDAVEILSAAIILLVNSLFYVADVLFIICFYTYHVFQDYGDY